VPHKQTPSLRLYYELEGDPAGPPLILIAGQSAQLTSWHPDLRHLLIEQGFRVILFDNRTSDCRSSRTPGSLRDLGHGERCRRAPERSRDGRSPRRGPVDGGMVAQQLTVDHPTRVLSLCSIYSAPSIEHLVNDPEVWAIREQEPATDREGAIAQYIERESLLLRSRRVHPRVDPRPRGGHLRPVLLPGGGRPTYGGSPSRPGPHTRTAAGERAHRRLPRTDRRPVGQLLRRGWQASLATSLTSAPRRGDHGVLDEPSARHHPAVHAAVVDLAGQHPSPDDWTRLAPSPVRSEAVNDD
jgi:pimeloyl-ACP methyl ester carboxylesterase